MKTPRSGIDWETLARREAYFPLLGSEGEDSVKGSEVATAAFFETGEADVAVLFSAMNSLLGRAIHAETALDFGCGAGRLTIPLARRCGGVTGCDLAPAMLAHARENLDRAGFSGVALIANEALADLPQGSFDLVCSLLVFQYVPPSTGLPLIRTLVDLLTPRGVAALHVMLERPADRRRRLLAFLNRKSSRGIVVASQSAGAGAGVGAYVYDEMRILRAVEECGARLAGRFPIQRGQGGYVLIIEKGAETGHA